MGEPSRVCNLKAFNGFASSFCNGFASSSGAQRISTEHDGNFQRRRNQQIVPPFPMGTTTPSPSNEVLVRDLEKMQAQMSNFGGRLRRISPITEVEDDSRSPARSSQPVVVPSRQASGHSTAELRLSTPGRQSFDPGTAALRLPAHSRQYSVPSSNELLTMQAEMESELSAAQARQAEIESELLSAAQAAQAEMESELAAAQAELRRVEAQTLNDFATEAAPGAALQRSQSDGRPTRAAQEIQRSRSDGIYRPRGITQELRHVRDENVSLLAQIAALKSDNARLLLQAKASQNKLSDTEVIANTGQSEVAAITTETQSDDTHVSQIAEMEALKEAHSELLKANTELLEVAAITTENADVHVSQLAEVEALKKANTELLLEVKTSRDKLHAAEAAANTRQSEVAAIKGENADENVSLFAHEKTLKKEMTQLRIEAKDCDKLSAAETTSKGDPEASRDELSAAETTSKRGREAQEESGTNSVNSQSNVTSKRGREAQEESDTNSGHSNAVMFKAENAYAQWKVRESEMLPLQRSSFPPTRNRNRAVQEPGTNAIQREVATMKAENAYAHWKLQEREILPAQFPMVREAPMKRSLYGSPPMRNAKQISRKTFGGDGLDEDGKEDEEETDAHDDGHFDDRRTTSCKALEVKSHAAVCKVDDRNDNGDEDGKDDNLQELQRLSEEMLKIKRENKALMHHLNGGLHKLVRRPKALSG